MFCSYNNIYYNFKFISVGDIMSKLITGQTTQEVWPQILRNIMNRGHDIKDERGSNTKEITNLMVTITMPEFSNLPKVYPLQAVADNYESQLLDGGLYGFIYTYGNRLRKHFTNGTKTKNIDQIQVVIDKLIECRESRRAVAVTYDPRLDTVFEEIPCLILVEFLIRENCLYVTGLWRSHDMFGGYPANFIALKKLAEFVAKETNSTVHEITTHSVSAHIYETNFQEARNVFK